MTAQEKYELACELIDLGWDDRSIAIALHADYQTVAKWRAKKNGKVTEEDRNETS